MKKITIILLSFIAITSIFANAQAYAETSSATERRLQHAQKRAEREAYNRIVRSCRGCREAKGGDIWVFSRLENGKMVTHAGWNFHDFAVVPSYLVTVNVPSGTWIEGQNVKFLHHINGDQNCVGQIVRNGPIKLEGMGDFELHTGGPVAESTGTYYGSSRQPNAGSPCY